jgi:hypothetical protein
MALGEELQWRVHRPCSLVHRGLYVISVHPSTDSVVRARSSRATAAVDYGCDAIDAPDVARPARA